MPDDERAMPESAPCVALRAAMGIGKGVIAASQTESYLTKNPDASVLYLSPRGVVLPPLSAGGKQQHMAAEEHGCSS